MALRGHLIGVKTELVTETCCWGGCGLLFAIPTDWKERRMEDHSQWYCPNGHSQSYTGETEAEKLRRELASVKGNLKFARERANRLQDDNMDLANSNRALKAAKTRIINRVKAGVCPFCRRNFENLARHMGAKHKQTEEAGDGA